MLAAHKEDASSDRIQIIVGAAALKLGQEEYLLRMFQQEFAIVREDELSVLDL